MKKLFLIVLAGCFLPALAPAEVVRPAPDFGWLNSTGQVKKISDLKGQPVVVIVSRSPRDRIFRAQVGQLQKMYERLADQKIVFVAAFTEAPGRIKSNIPFVIAPDGPRVANDLGITGKFGIAFIGRDRNLDYITQRVVPAQRIYDIVGASFVPQERLRRP